MKNCIEITETVQRIESITCDICGKVYSYKDHEEFQEFLSIDNSCGYGSVFGDGNFYEVDMCQHCVKEKLGEWLRIKSYLGNMEA